jgi:hypothetical protein
MGTAPLANHGYLGHCPPSFFARADALTIARILPPAASGNLAPWWYTVARSRALALLAGLSVETKSGLTSAEPEASADQAVAALADVKTAWGLPGELRGSDFDALRPRPDFQKLVTEVDSKAKKPQGQ